MPKVEFNDVIDSDADDAWNVLKKFGEISKWHKDIAESHIDNDMPDGIVGCTRKLTLVDGGTILERLLSTDDINRSLTYRFEEAPLPLDNYTLTVAVTPLTRERKSFIRWSATFDLRETDPEGNYVKLMQSLIIGGSDSLQAYLSSKH
ncbi:SRPBCC family protein [Agrobacterium tumefaciens]|uniref:SRPBCC family protein n=1 Tax=Agrobacterium tumefaciens TaxID=358 RepID=UPI0012B6F8BB|nr:SRPBCC family protein [Agrobacterium tumefaciens]MQB08014.1 SRPBCC family protein [Agrobacterium tumefaciens]